MDRAEIHHAEVADETLAEPPTRELGTQVDTPSRELPTAPAATEDRCSNCGAHIAHDQRYCVECGERRGQSRFPVTEPATEIRARRTTRSARSAAGSPRVSSGTTLVAGIGVLLLAIGLGVLIGSIANKNNTSTRANAPAQTIIMQGGGGTGTAAAASTPTAPTSRPKTVHVTKKVQAKLKAAAAATAPPPAAVQQKAVQAAGKVLGNSKNLPPPTVTTGQKCASSQAGCSGGTFNGNFFGP